MAFFDIFTKRNDTCVDQALCIAHEDNANALDKLLREVGGFLAEKQLPGPNHAPAKPRLGRPGDH